MDEELKKRISDNLYPLTCSLVDHVDEVCKYLCEKDIITKNNKRTILGQKTPPCRSSNLLEQIVNKGPWAFEALYEACKKRMLIDVADILRPNKAPHQKFVINGAEIILAEDEQPLPDSWPPPKEHLERVKSETLNVRKVIQSSNPEMYKLFEKHIELPAKHYSMRHKYRGNALIICNITFSNPKLDRLGSEYDVRGLGQLFYGLGFHVFKHVNQNIESIRKIIKEETEKDHSNHDCFVFFILSHGKKGGEVYGTHDGIIKKQEMIDAFKNVKDLRSKPKLLFFQVCSGDMSEKGHLVGTSEASQDCKHNRHYSTDDEECDASASSDDRDVFEFCSSPEGQKSYRDSSFGSWFAQAVIYVFSEFAHRCDFIELTRKVKALLSLAETSDSMKNISVLKHVPSGRTLHFFPGLSDIEGTS